MTTKADKFKFVVTVAAYNKTCSTPPLGELTQALSHYLIRDLGDRLDSDLYQLSVDAFSKSITGSWCRDTFLYYDNWENNVQKSSVK